MWTYALWLVPVVLAVPVVIFMVKRSHASSVGRQEVVPVYEKKYTPFRLGRYNVFLGNVAMALSLLLVIWAFGFKVYDNNSPYIDVEPAAYHNDELVTATVMKKPVPPKPKVQTVVVDIIEVDDEPLESKPDDLVKDTPDNNNPTTDVPYDNEPIAAAPAAPPVPEPDDIEKIFIGTEIMPQPVGGMPEYLQNIARNLKYPEDMKRTGIEGRVYVSFIVEKDGSLSHITIEKGVHKSGDAEVLRIMKLSPKWKPGKQSGRAVRVKMHLPVAFRLK